MGRVPVENAVTQEESNTPPLQKRTKVNGGTLPTDVWRNKREDFTDIEFVVNGERFSAHKMVLASQSEYFRGLLYGGMREASLKMITLPEDIITKAAFKKVLQYAYTGSINIAESLNDTMDIIRTADYLRFDQLKSSTEHVAKKYICHDTVLQLCVYIEKYNLQLPHLEAELCEFTAIRSNTCRMLESPSFLELPQECVVSLLSRDTFVASEHEILEAVLRWKRYNKMSNKEMSEVVKCIRLCRFSTREIFTEVEPTGLFTEIELLAGLRILSKPDLLAAKPRGRLKLRSNLLDHAHFAPSGQLSKTFEFEESDYPYNSYGVITLPKHYLANYLCFEAEDKLKWYSYTISVQLDGQPWLQLFDYSAIHCRGRQVLHFPTIPIKRVKLCIDAKESEKILIRVSLLQYLEDRERFKFLSRGVIAPLTDHTVEFVPFSKTENGSQTAGAHFKQPYSASTVSILLVCDNPIEAKVGFKVVLGERREISMPITQNLGNVDIGSPICVSFEEMVIGYIEVTISLCEAARPGPELPMVTIASIVSKSGATVDDVDTVVFSNYLTAN